MREAMISERKKSVFTVAFVGSSDMLAAMFSGQDDENVLPDGSDACPSAIGRRGGNKRWNAQMRVGSSLLRETPTRGRVQSETRIRKHGGWNLTSIR